jgi:hypothetical protein
MNVMSRSSRLALFAVAAAGLLPVTAAQAQYYGSPPPPLYPYVAQSAQPYAVQVAPKTARPSSPKPERFDRPHKSVDHALIQELRKGSQSGEQTEAALHKTSGRGIANTTRIVRDAPVVRETHRIVDDPPRIIERRQIVDDDTGIVEQEPPVQQAPRRDDNRKRVIAADAEVTILGPDRMSIRLFRKGQGPKANAKAD